MEDEHKEAINKIHLAFKEIKEKGFVESHRLNNTGIGKTFEDLMKIEENNLKIPDFDIFEVKSRRIYTSSYVTLFTKSPSYPKNANTHLRETYGRPDVHHPDIKVLHTSFFGNRFNNYDGRYKFGLQNIPIEKKVYIQINDINDGIVEREVYFSYQDILLATNKLKNLFVVSAQTRNEDSKEYFHYTNADAFIGFNINKFYELINEGVIMFDIRIGAYKSGKSYGKSHDHGSGFRVRKENIKDLYNTCIKLD